MDTRLILIIISAPIGAGVGAWAAIRFGTGALLRRVNENTRRIERLEGGPYPGPDTYPSTDRYPK